MGVTIAKVQTTAITGGGPNQDITTTDLGGLTPKAALFFISGATSLDSAAAHARLGIGVTDGTNQWDLSWSAEDNQGTSDTYRRPENDECIQILNAADGTVDGEANFNSFITNGVRITWGDYPASAVYLTVVLFAGTDVSAYVSSFTSHATINQATTVSGVGFEADVVVCCWSYAAAGEGTTSNHLRAGFGVCVNDGSDTQASSTWQWPDNQATTVNDLALNDDYAVSYLRTHGIEIDNFGADGFDAYSRLTGAARSVYYLALNFNGAISTGLDILTTPTSTGNQGFTVSLGGDTPQLALMGMTKAAAVDTLYNNVSEAGTVGFYVCDADDEASHAIQDEDNVATTNSQSYAAAKAVLDDDDGAGLFDASFVSFAANTVTLNFAETDTGTARKWWCLSFGAAAAVDNLTATGITTGAADLGTPTVGQIHALTATGITTGSPDLGTPTVGQVHALTATGITTGSPDLGTPTAGQAHVLSATGITTGSPDLGTPTVGQIHALTATGITTGSPTLGTPILAEEGTDVLEATGITTGSPDLGTPTVGQVHALTATGTVTGSPDLGTPTVAEAAHPLEATGITTGAPVLGTPALGQVHALTATALVTGSPDLGTPTVGQEHALTATGITAGTPALGTPTLAIPTIDNLTATGITVGAPIIGLAILAIVTTPARRKHSVPEDDRTWNVPAQTRSIGG